MIEYKHSGLFNSGSVDKRWKIEYDGGQITNEEFFSQSIELTESLCSETELRFGSCEASVLKFKVGNIILPLIGKQLTVSMVIGHQESAPLMIGKYRVVSDKPTSDRRHRDIVAYDAMYDIVNADVADWYRSVLPTEESTLTLRQFRESFLMHFGLEEVLPLIGKDAEGRPVYGLVNDGMVVEQTIQPEQISGLDVITAICEINGCFGHIGRDGKFRYIYLPQAIEGLYPSSTLFPDHAPEWMAQARTGHLYPQSPKSTRISGGKYITVRYEDFRTKSIDKLQIRQEEDDIGLIYGSGENCYIIQDNFLVYGKSSEQLEVIAANIFGRIKDIVYRPYDADVIGNPCFEVGDPVRFPTRYELVESYILERTLKGLQGLTDTFSAKGTEVYAEKVNSIHKSIVQLKGKTNILTRTIEETKLEMKDMGEGLSATISVTASQIRTELENARDGLQSSIMQTASQIRMEVMQADEGLSSRITQNANSITSEVQRATAAEGVLSTTIQQTEEGILSTVSRTYATQDDFNRGMYSMSSAIQQAYDGISMKVSKGGEVISEINLSEDTIRLGAGRLVIESGNFQLDKLGNCQLSGNFTVGTDEDYGYIKCRSLTVREITPLSSGQAIQFNGWVQFNAEVGFYSRVAVHGHSFWFVHKGNSTELSGKLTEIEYDVEIMSQEVESLRTEVFSLRQRVSALESASTE